MQSSVRCRPPIRPQFSLWALFEFTTLCCILAALSGVLGVGAAVCLMLMGLALNARQGALALSMIWVATIVSTYTTAIDSGNVAAELTTIVVAICVCGWYRWRAKGLGSEAAFS